MELNREDIKAALRKQGYTLSRAAGELGVTKQALSMVLAGKRSHRIEAWIAQRLVLKPEEVWPERYSLNIVNTTVPCSQNLDLQVTGESSV